MGIQTSVTATCDRPQCGGTLLIPADRTHQPFIAAYREGWTVNPAEGRTFCPRDHGDVEHHGAMFREADDGDVWLYNGYAGSWACVFTSEEWEVHFADINVDGSLGRGYNFSAYVGFEAWRALEERYGIEVDR